MATALTGCVIVEQNNMTMRYKKKCEMCGFLESGQTLTALIKPGSKLSSAFLCPKCKRQNKILIQG